VGVQNSDNLPAQVVVPHLANRVGEDWAQLLQLALSLSGRWGGPLILPRAVYQRGHRQQAGIIRLSLRLGDSVRIRSIGDSAGTTSPWKPGLEKSND